MSPVSCGPLYRSIRNQFTDDDPEKNRAFAVGMVTGNAEKVYLGACKACMFRPGSSAGLAFLLFAVHAVCETYHLEFEVEKFSEELTEIWVFRPDNHEYVKRLHDHEVNSRAWHRYRAMLCGVPSGEVDTEFHLRRGAGDNVDGRI